MAFQKHLLSGVAAAAFAVGAAQAQTSPNPDQPDASASASTSAQQKSQQVNLSTDRNISTNPLFPLPVILGLGGLVLIVGGIGAYRRAKDGSVPGMLAGGLATVMLLNPAVIDNQNKKMPTEVIVVVDRSESNQSIGTRAQETDAVLDHIRKQLEPLGGDINLHVIDSKRRDSTGRPDDSNLFALLDETTGIPYNRRGAVIFLTDGQTRGMQGTPEAIGKETPFHALVSGKDNEFDLRIVVDQAPKSSLVKQKQVIKFHTQVDGEYDSAKTPVRVEIRRDGNKVSEKTVVPGEVAEVTVDIPHAGSNIIELQASIIPGELIENNNRIVVPIEGIRKQMNVLYFSGKPHLGTRMWENALRENSDTALIQFITLRPSRKIDDTPEEEMALVPLPMHELFSEKLKSIDLVIFDRYEGIATLPPTYFDNLVSYIPEGGAVFVAAGPEYARPRSLYNSSLGSILSARPTGNMLKVPFVPRATSDGEKHPVTRGLGGEKNITDPSWGRWLSMAETEATGGHVVLSGDQDKPLLILERKGKGRIATLTSDNAYLWERDFDGGGPHEALLQKAIDWLLQNPDLEEEALRLSARNGELIIHRQTMLDKTDPIKVTTPTGIITVTPKPVGPGQWEARIKATAEGLYSAEQSGQHPLTAHFNLGTPNLAEFSGVVSTLEKLAPLAIATGGSAKRIDTSSLPRLIPIKAKDAKNGLSGSGWIGIRMTDETTLVDQKKTPLMSGWTGAGLMLAFALLAGFAFYREGGKDNRPGWRDVVPFAKRKEGPEVGGP